MSLFTGSATLPCEVVGGGFMSDAIASAPVGRMSFLGSCWRHKGTHMTRVTSIVEIYVQGVVFCK